MKRIRSPKINAAIILIITTFYSLVFILTSGHIEFERMLKHSSTLNSAFWNTWSDFLMQGNMKYIGYAYIILAAAITALSFARKQNFDEYQTGILERGLIVAGILIACLFPLALLLILSDPNYAVETIIFLVIVHWSVALIADLVYILKWSNA